jgi:hypothetical protein
MKTPNAEQLAALRAIANGRLPREETMIARLRRAGLIRRNVFDRGYHVTQEGQALLNGSTLPAR